MKKLFGKLIFKILGWEIVGSIPKIKKYVVISAPHTSNWDFFFGRCFAYVLDIKPRYLVKSELYIWPLSILIKLNGGIPVYRRKTKKTVDQLVKRFQTTENLILGIAPEGTRSRVEKWKTGFYFIAQKANVPIVLVYMDYKKKEIGYFDILNPSGDLQKDLQKIQEFYESVIGKKPELYNSKIY